MPGGPAAECWPADIGLAMSRARQGARAREPLTCGHDKGGGQPEGAFREAAAAWGDRTKISTDGRRAFCYPRCKRHDRPQPLTGVSRVGLTLEEGSNGLQEAPPANEKPGTRPGFVICRALEHSNNGALGIGPFPECSNAVDRSIVLLLYSLRLSAPLSGALSILAMASSSPFRLVQCSSVRSFSRRQSSSRGTHSKTDPLAIPKTFTLLLVCHLPLPSAMFKEMDGDTRLNISVTPTMTPKGGLSPAYGLAWGEGTLLSAGLSTTDPVILAVESLLLTTG